MLVFWQLLSLDAFDRSALIPSPYDAASRLLQNLSESEGWRNVFSTLIRMTVGFCLATIVGISIGFIMGLNKTMNSILCPIVDFCRSVPVTSLYPVFVICLGVNTSSHIAMIFFACVFVIALNTSYGVLGRSETRRNLAGLYGATGWQRIRHIYIYEALPNILVGLRVALSFSLIVAVLCELFMGSRYGIGQRLSIAFATYRMDELFSWILLTGIIGYIINLAFVDLERRVVSWK